MSGGLLASPICWAIDMLSWRHAEACTCSTCCCYPTEELENRKAASCQADGLNDTPEQQLSSRFSDVDPHVDALLVVIVFQNQLLSHQLTTIDSLSCGLLADLPEYAVQVVFCVRHVPYNLITVVKSASDHATTWMPFFAVWQYGIETAPVRKMRLHCGLHS